MIEIKFIDFFGTEQYLCEKYLKEFIKLNGFPKEIARDRKMNETYGMVHIQNIVGGVVWRRLYGFLRRTFSGY